MTCSPSAGLRGENSRVSAWVATSMPARGAISRTLSLSPLPPFRRVGRAGVCSCERPRTEHEASLLGWIVRERVQLPVPLAIVQAVAAAVEDVQVKDGGHLLVEAA